MRRALIASVSVALYARATAGHLNPNTVTVIAQMALAVVVLTFPCQGYAGERAMRV